MKNLITDFFRDAPATAATLAAAVKEVEREREEAQASELTLAQARESALLRNNDDAEVDRIEESLRRVQRQLDRIEVRLPELRKKHARQAEIEERASNARAFDEAIGHRLEAAREVDAALATLGRAFVNLDAAGDKLAGLQGYHGVSYGTDGAVTIGRTSPISVKTSALRFAPIFARLMHIFDCPGDNRPLAETESAFWNEIQRRLALRQSAMELEGQS